MRCVLSSEHPLSPEVMVTDSTPYTIVLTLDHSEVCFEDYTFHYKISWSRADGEWSLPVEVPLIPSYTITGLSPGSEYRVRVLAESEEDSTVVSGPVTVIAVTLAGVYCIFCDSCLRTIIYYCVYMHLLFSVMLVFSSVSFRSHYWIGIWFRALISYYHSHIGWFPDFLCNFI